jgi:uncharacterized coiled-coil protein SlyX
MTDILSPSPWAAVQETREERLHARIAELEFEVADLNECLTIAYLQGSESAKYRIAELEAALEPFAQIADELSPVLRDHEQNGMAWAAPKVGDFRRARAALAKGKP